MNGLESNWTNKHEGRRYFQNTILIPIWTAQFGILPSAFIRVNRSLELNLDGDLRYRIDLKSSPSPCIQIEKSLQQASTTDQATVDCSQLEMLVIRQSEKQ